jgi:hypothetical protein
MKICRRVATIQLLAILVWVSFANVAAVSRAANEQQNCRQKLPTSIIIGVKKSGTYALLRYLNLNPHIRGALKLNGVRLNEIHYFDKDINFNRGVDWYRKQMPFMCDKENDNETIVIEKTPGYFRSKEAPRRIHEYNSEMKLILIVRDPVRRLESELTHCDLRQKSLGIERKCVNISDYFERMLRDNRTSESDWLANRFIRNSVYYLDLLNWLSYFQLDRQLLIVDGERFIKTPWVELNRVERFLGVHAGSFISRKNFYFDKAKNFYCLRADLTGAWNVTANSSNSRCLGKNKGRKRHIYLSDYVRKELGRFFVKWNGLLFDLIGKRFDW